MITLCNQGKIDKELILPLDEVSTIVGENITQILLHHKDFSWRWWLSNIFDREVFSRYLHRCKDANLALQTYMLESGVFISNKKAR